MNLSEKCKLYVKAGLAYENAENYIVSDETYDSIARQLLKNYEKLPKWFTNKVSADDLHTGSAAGFKEKFLCNIFKVVHE